MAVTTAKKKHSYYAQRNTFFDYLNIVFQIGLSLTIMLPFIHLFVISISSSATAIKPGLHLWPDEVQWINYQRVLQSHFIWIGYRNTIIRTIIGTTVQLFMTSMAAFVLSKGCFPHRTFWTLMIIFTMYFSGGTIPHYLLMKELNLFDTYAALILPGLVGTYNMVLVRNYMQAIPQDLEDACMIDGAGHFTTFVRIILPVSMPILATVALWLAVGHWNAWFDCLLYMRSNNKVVLQVVLRRIILEGTQEMIDSSPSALSEVNVQPSTDGLKAATVYVATIPILCVYPFVQKYFVKGIMVGSLKG